MHNVIPITRRTKRATNSLRNATPDQSQSAGFVVFEVRGNVISPILAREGELIVVDLTASIATMLATCDPDGLIVRRSVARGARHLGNVVRDLCVLLNSGALELLMPSDYAVLLQFLRTGELSANEVRA